MILNFNNSNKGELFEIMSKYDPKFPNLGTAISKTIQGINTDEDINIIDEFIVSKVLEKTDEVTLDKLFILRPVEF
jgi:hypothetical protein